MSGTGSWLQFANRMNKFKGSYFQDFADISGDVIVRNTGNVYLHAGSNMYMTAGDISMNGYIYCKGVVDLSGNSLSGGGDGGGGGLTSLSTVGVKSINTTDFMTTGGYATVGGYFNVTGSTTLNGPLTMNSASTFNGQLDGSGGSFNSLSVGTIELRGDIIPDTNITYDIGSADNKFRDLYVSESSIWIGDNNKMAVENNKITMKRRKRGDTDIPKFIRDKISFPNLSDKVAHVKTFASTNSLGKTSSDLLSTYTVTDWIRFANKKAQLGQDGFTKTNHTGSDLYDLTADFDNDDSGQWSTISTGVINYDGKITVGTSETLGKATILGNVAIGGYSNSNAELYINGNTINSGALEVNGITYLSTTNIGASLTVSQNTNITGKLGVGKSADGTHHLDVLGSARIQNDAYFKKSLLIGTGVNSTSLATHNATGASMYIETPMVAGVYPAIPHNVVINVPNTVFKAQDNSIITNTNSLVIDATNRSILPYVRDVNGNLVNSGMTNGWVLGGPGANRFDAIHARDISISTETINIEDGSGNKIGMSFDATTGSVNYTVVTKDTADASGETFVIKGVQTQKISSGGGTIDPALLEFTGLSFGDTFDSALVYDLSTTYTYNLSTTAYTGDGTSVFTTNAGAQTLANFATLINEQTLLGSLPTKESAVIRVGVDDRADGGLNGIDTVGSKIDLTNKIVSVTDDDGGSTLKWTLWGSEAELNASNAGNYLNYIELKNINMASGTYFVAKTSGTIVYNNATQDFLTNDDMIGVVNGDLFLYIDRSPGNNWTKIPVSLPASGSITTQMLTDGVIQPVKIANNAVTESKITDGAVTTNKIADASITAVKFKAGEINGTIFADDAIDGAKISGNIDTGKLVGNISGTLITDNTIVSSKIVDGAITSAKIAYLGVSGDNLMNDSVTTLKIADGAVIASKIPDGVITSAKLASGVINSATLIADNVITESKIFGGSVTEAKLASLSVGSGKIKDDAITETKIADGAVTLAKINGSVFAGKQDTLVAGSGIAITINSDGNPEISSTVSASVGTGDITTDLIADGAITAAKLANGISIGGGGGGSGGGSSGGGSTGIFFNKPETEIIGSANQKIGHGSKGWYYNHGSYIYGSLSNNVHMNDDGNLIVVCDKNKNTLIYAYASDTWSLKQTINIPALSGDGDTAVLSKDGTTIAIRAKVTGWQLNDYPTCGTYIYIYKDPTATWDTVPSQLAITKSGHTNAFGLSHALSSDGSIMAVCTSNSTLQTATNSHNHIFVFNTDTYASDPNPIITIPLDTYPDVVTTTKIIGKIQISGDASKIFLNTKKTTNSILNARLIKLDYTNNTYSDHFDFSTTPEATRAALSSNSGSFNGFSMNNDGTRMVFGINQHFNSSYSQLLFYHNDGSNWSLESNFTHLTLGYTDLPHTDIHNPGTLYARSAFINDNKVAVFSSHYNNSDFPSFIFTFEYIDNTWTKTNVIEMGGVGLLETGFAVSSTGSYAYVQPLYDSNRGRIAISLAEEVEINTNNIKTKTLLLDDGKHDFVGGTHGGLGTTYSTKATGTHIIESGNMIISSNELNTVGTGDNMINTNKYFDKSPMLVLAHNSTGTAQNILHRPAIEFRTTQMSALATHDWRMYSQGSGGISSDLILQNGRFVNNKHYRFDMVRFTGDQGGTYGGMILNYNVIGIEGDGTKRQLECQKGVMILKPDSSNAGNISLRAGALGYSSGTVGIELHNGSTQAASIFTHRNATHFKTNDMSVMAKGDMNFYTNVEKFSNYGEANQTSYKRMTISNIGNVTIGTEDKSAKLNVGGSLAIDGLLTGVTGFVNPLSIIENSSIVANTAPMADDDYDVTKALGSSSGDRICMNGDGTLIVMANVSLKTVYTFRLINNVWEDFATVVGDSSKYIYKNTTYFGKVIALSKDGLTLFISDRQSVWKYNWNSVTSQWDEDATTLSDANYTTNNHSVGFCHNMKITDDGSKILIISYASSINYKLRIYDTSTGAVLVNVTDNTDTLFGHTNIDPGIGYSYNAYSRGSTLRGFQNWNRWKIAMSGDGTSVAISGVDAGTSTGQYFYQRTTLLFDIDYSTNTSSPNNHFDSTVTGRTLNGRSLAFNSDGTLFAIAIGNGHSTTRGDHQRVSMYRRTLGTPTIWTMEKEYSPMPELVGGGSGSDNTTGDGFGEQIIMNADASVIYIAAHTSEHYYASLIPKQHFVGRVEYDGAGWKDMGTISGPRESYWGVGIVCDNTGNSLSVSDIKNYNITNHGGGFNNYSISKSNLKFTSPDELRLSGGGSIDNHLTISNAGDVGIGISPTIGVKLNVDGNISATGTIASSSDDRLKINELLITNAITTIKNLRPEIYDKKPSFNNNSQSEWIKESGLIAQEVWYSTPELRHLVSLGYNIETKDTLENSREYESKTHYIIKHMKDASDNELDYEDIFILNEFGNINLDSSGNYEIDIGKFLLLDGSGIIVKYNGVDVLDYTKLKQKNITGISFKKNIQQPKLDVDGSIIHDNSGNICYIDVEVEVLDANNNPLINSMEQLTFTTPPIVVKQKYTKIYKHDNGTKQIYTPINPSDIQDYTPTDDIQNDPDYKALGWGDTPAHLNYTGLIPYLVKAMQEQQDTIELLKTEVNALKNA